MKKLSVVWVALIAVCLCLPVAAREARVDAADYAITLFYNDVAQPGDAVFVRMKLSPLSKRTAPITKAVLELYLNDKRLDKADFFSLPAQTSALTRTMLAGVPLSSWWKDESGYLLKVTYTAGAVVHDFTLPFSIQNKEFVSETIPLDSRNTGIKTDTSATRMAQIEKLNAILGTVDPSAVYQTRPYTPPTPATRRTSFFADRRVYAYTNGKSSTSLHYGTDYGVPEGSLVTACADGKVVMAEDRISTGWSVVIEHLPGLYSLYYHMSELKVKEGDVVSAGDLVGLSGSTGLATGPHLHWEMRLNMSAVNPDFFTTDFTFSEQD